MESISLPDGFGISVFADFGGEGLSYPGPNNGPRLMAFRNGTLFVTMTKDGKVVALPDENKDSKADKVVVFADKLRNPHGIALNKDWVYIAEEDKVSRFKDANFDLEPDSEPETMVYNIPTGGHFTRTLLIHNNSLYISIGSSCNVCFEETGMRGAIIQCDLEGNNCLLFASGLRNAVGMAVNEKTQEIFATDNGRDLLGDDIPPEEIDVLVKGKNYGWPLCYGNRIHDTDFDKNIYIRDPCADTEPPVVEMQAHSAPLGLTFYHADQFPEEYRGNLFVAFHGSWNRKEPTGYKVVRIIVDGNKTVVKDFATGWLYDGKVRGRPVDVVVAPDGSLFVSDDNSGRIYRVYYEAN
ncbi:MAG: sorbosone dehydrogenase family protein [Candidatus Aenigmarchaeota archaeon]|nr:sorbosone dehydrogenase family protein [Candidatus Aenigmarchaeota archaeon]